MIRLVFPALLTIHGLIHMIGFSKEWKLGPESMLTGATLFPFSNEVAKALGILWFVTSLTLVTAAYLYARKVDAFWILALIGIGLSQALITIYWQDAKFGTIINIIVLLVVVINIARVNFQKNTTAEITRIIDTSSASHRVAAPDNIDKLPPVIQKWLKVSGSTNTLPAQIKITQEGKMKTKPDGSWLDFVATQLITIDPPAFLWNSKINAGGLITIAGRDKFENGKGNMLIKPLFIYPLANSSGDEIDQGTMLRYMGEIIWYPEAALANYFQWNELDSTRAELTMTYKGVTATGIFSFDQNGLMNSFSAERFGDFDGEFRKETWEVKAIEHKEMNNRLIPNKCEVTWKLKEGDFMWLTMEIKQIEYH